MMTYTQWTASLGLWAGRSSEAKAILQRDYGKYCAKWRKDNEDQNRVDKR